MHSVKNRDSYSYSFLNTESKRNIECCTKIEIKATVSLSITVLLYSLQPHMKGDKFTPTTDDTFLMTLGAAKTRTRK